MPQNKILPNAGDEKVLNNGESSDGKLERHCLICHNPQQRRERTICITCKKRLHTRCGELTIRGVAEK